MISDEQFRTLWRSPKSITGDTLLLFGCGAAALALGAMIAIAAAPPKARLSVAWPGLNESSLRLLSLCSTILTAAALVGYLAFAYLIAQSGLGLSGLASNPETKIIGRIPGVTTLTTFGIAAVVASTIVLVHRFSGVELFKVLILVGLAIPRAFINGERLVILELVVPVVVLSAARISSQRGVRRTLTQLVPFIAVPLVVAMFAVFEYFRSWTRYKDSVETSYTEFALNRLGGYYATAVNNGQLTLDHLNWPNRLPFYTIEPFWTAPGIRHAQLYEKLGGYPTPYAQDYGDSPYLTVLRQFGNPEFNNNTGYVTGFIDYGRIGGIVYFLLVGVVIGLLYCAFCEGKLAGLVLYPVAFLGLLELPRYMYWAMGRSVYMWIGLLAVIIFVSAGRAMQRPITNLASPASPDADVGSVRKSV
jgi:oligosaccharide repeat unit polymerase